jgi:hypothetical protein
MCLRACLRAHAWCSTRGMTESEGPSKPQRAGFWAVLLRPPTSLLGPWLAAHAVSSGQAAVRVSHSSKILGLTHSHCMRLAFSPLSQCKHTPTMALRCLPAAVSNPKYLCIRSPTDRCAASAVFGPGSRAGRPSRTTPSTSAPRASRRARPCGLPTMWCTCLRPRCASRGCCRTSGSATSWQATRGLTKSSSGSARCAVRCWCVGAAHAWARM